LNKENNKTYIFNEKYNLAQIGTFFVISFIITWSIIVPSLNYLPEGERTLTFILAAFGPMMAAIIVIWRFKGKKELINWIKNIFKIKIPLSYYLYGIIIIPIGIGVLHYSLYRFLGGIPDNLSAVPWKYYLIYIVLTLLTGGNEEPGWRGFALTALLDHYHPLIASLILGLAHSAWHLPLMNHYDTVFGHYLFNLLPLTVVFNWLYLRSKGSVWPVMFLHSGTNIISSFIPTPIPVLGGLGDFMVLRGIVYWGMALTIIFATKGNLGYARTQIRRRPLD
jgi:membrane protease YdiL (CAAX protease family)